MPGNCAGLVFFVVVVVVVVVFLGRVFEKGLGFVFVDFSIREKKSFGYNARKTLPLRLCVVLQEEKGHVTTLFFFIQP